VNIQSNVPQRQFPYWGVEIPTIIPADSRTGRRLATWSHLTHFRASAGHRQSPPGAVRLLSSLGASRAALKIQIEVRRIPKDIRSVPQKSQPGFKRRFRASGVSRATPYVPSLSSLRPLRGWGVFRGRKDPRTARKRTPPANHGGIAAFLQTRPLPPMAGLPVFPAMKGPQTPLLTLQRQTGLLRFMNYKTYSHFRLFVDFRFPLWYNIDTGRPTAGDARGNCELGRSFKFEGSSFN